MIIAVEGCLHGEIENLYDYLASAEKRNGLKINLLLCCGDFQSVRNSNDLNNLAVPERYRKIGTFHKYISGEKTAPILTIFIGGNHEASNLLQELPYGGFVAPKIYYLGRVGVVKCGGIRIGGLSGIYSEQEYLQGFWETPPYTSESLQSVHCVKEFDVFRLKHVREKIDIMLSHDWPRNITCFGNEEELLRTRPQFRPSIEAKTLGSPPAEYLLHHLKPTYWFSAHMHWKFSANVKHCGNAETKFIALDKFMAGSCHLEIIDMPTDCEDVELKYDVEWLTILRKTNKLMSVLKDSLPGLDINKRSSLTRTAQELRDTIDLIEDLRIKDDFVKTAPSCAILERDSIINGPVLNVQTEVLCKKLGIDDPVAIVTKQSGRNMFKYNVLDEHYYEIYELC